MTTIVCNTNVCRPLFRVTLHWFISNPMGEPCHRYSKNSEMYCVIVGWPLAYRKRSWRRKPTFTETTSASLNAVSEYLPFWLSSNSHPLWARPCPIYSPT
jgi:hypothetical protein